MIKRLGWWRIKYLLTNIHQSYLVVALATGIIVGVILGLVLGINYFASPAWIGFVAGLFGLAYWKPNILFVVLLLVAGMVLAFFRVSGELFDAQYVRQFYGQVVVVSGVIDGDPETDEKDTKFKLRDLKFGDAHEVTGSIYVTVAKNEDLARSDLISLEGKMLNGFGVYSGYLYRPSIKKWERPEPGDLVLKVRNWFAKETRTLIPQPEVDLGLSYLLGMKTGLPDDLEENLRVAGLEHIVVASGAHLSILVEVARRIFGKLSRFAGLVFSIIFVVFFMSMVGCTPSILRAGTMTILTLIAWYSGRKIAPWRMIMLVAAFTLMLDPMFVLNLGWLLSFASYGGIMILGPKLAKFFYGAKKPGLVSSMILVTISATLMTLPITLYYYGTISLISMIANLLILPTLPYAMGLVFLTGVFVWVPGIGTMIAWCATKMLDFHIMVVECFGGMEQFLVEIPKYQGWAFWFYIPIIILTVVLIFCKIRRSVNGYLCN